MYKKMLRYSAIFLFFMALLISCNSVKTEPTVPKKINIPIPSTQPTQNESSTGDYLEKTKEIFMGSFVPSLGDLGRQLKLIEGDPTIMFDENFKELVFRELNYLKSTTITLKQLPAPSEYENLSSLFDDLDSEIDQMAEDLRQAINNIDPDKFEQVYYHVDAIVSLAEKIDDYYR